MKPSNTVTTVTFKRQYFSITAIIKSTFMAGLLAISGLAQANTHPSYLTDSYCDSLVEQFIGPGMRSLGKYVNEDFNPVYTGNIRNTINYLDQRAEWLAECNGYLKDTNDTYVFYTEKSTEEIFTAIKALRKELQLVREGVEFPDETGADNPKPFIKNRFDTLAQLVDQHHTRMLMKKQFL
ncbi:hypothetical protein [Microbulbifer sp.]|uniref:hypothetical protein n=1 Tax=Microbulbifer sp. TaxID=1908541 RepID=UPI00258CE72B|nr:hypothetical protein [Microbulbifer sp.]